MNYNYFAILEKALKEGQKRHPDAPIQNHAAYANSVAYLITGCSGGYGGPSCREHAVSHSALDTAMPGNWSYNLACNFAESLCFGELQEIHFSCYRSENCFDDAPSDVEALKKWWHRDASS